MSKLVSAAMQCNNVYQLLALTIMCSTLCILAWIAAWVAFKALDTVKAFKMTSVKVAPDSVNVELHRD